MTPSGVPSAAPAATAAMRKGLVMGVVAGLVVGAVAGWALTRSGDPEALPATEVDIGFLQDMSDHHAQAILMSAHQFRYGSSEQVKALAYDILLSQTAERAQMGAMLADRGSGAGAPDRLANTWMGVGQPLEEMAGMVPRDKLAELLTLRGAELDRRFLELMSDHHIGGVHMAEHAAAEASDPRIRDLARRMASDQQAEIVDIGLLLGRG